MASMAWSIRVSSLLAFAALAAPSVAALTHEGGSATVGAPAVRILDTTLSVRPAVVAETAPLRQAGSFTFSHDSLFVASGMQVLRHSRRDLSAAASAAWSSSAPILEIADGEERGDVLVLHPDALTLVRFADAAAPAPIWSIPVAAGSHPGAGSRLLIRSGSVVYVADSSIPGIRVLALGSGTVPATIETFKSQEGRVVDMALWGRSLALLTDSSLIVLDSGAGDRPELRRLGSYSTRGHATSVDINSRYAFVGEGSMVSVLEIDPANPGLLAGPVERWDGQAEIRAIRLDRDRRAYVLLQNSFEILDVAPFGGR